MNNIQLEEIEANLICPITLELLEDPITVPCCKKAFSRQSLIQVLESVKICPSCRGNLINFNANDAPRETQINGMIDTYVQIKSMSENQIRINPIKDHIWSSKLLQLKDKYNKCDISLAELELCIDNPKFKTRPSLFIPVVDRSGSMAGSPWRQVECALLHIMGLTKTSPHVKTLIVAYDSNAELINTNGSDEEVTRIIKSMSAGGGTNFKAAFNKIKDVLKMFISSDNIQDINNPNNISNINIAFLTDGESGGNREELISDFRSILKDNWSSNVCVNAVGFGRNCDKILLEGLRTTGTQEGTFRYAELDENGDTLCNKLTALFEISSASSTIPINLKLNKHKFKVGNNYTNEISVQIPIDNSQGIFKEWVLLSDNDSDTLTINSLLDKDVQINCKVLNNHGKNDFLFEKWMTLQIDDIASYLFDLVKIKDKMSRNLIELCLALSEQKINAIKSVYNNSMIEKLDFLLNEIVSIRNGMTINIGKLSDFRFTSKFASAEIINFDTSKPIVTNYKPPQIIIDAPKVYIEQNIKYGRNYKDSRNTLQNFIVQASAKTTSYDTKRYIQKSSQDDILFQDDDGNNALHLAAHTGQVEIIKLILDKYPDIDLNVQNNDGETALTCAAKGGFWLSTARLIDAGSLIPNNRRQSLINFIKYKKTGKHAWIKTTNLMENMDDSSELVNMHMSEEHIIKKYNSIKNTNFNINDYLDVAMAKCMSELVKELIVNNSAKPKFEQIIKYCFPPKPDHIDTQKYLELTNVIMDNYPEFINKVNDNNETLLFTSVVKGSLPHVKYYLSKGIPVDQPNKLGNSPLWFACCKLYPCIIDELLNNGADINYMNENGNPPIYNICQYGSTKICENLLARGAIVDGLINKRDETMILICCRNGQHNILQMLLNSVSEEFVSYMASIDGFSALMASAEQNRAQCIKVLAEFGADLEQKTENNNPILPSATSLHIATYYNKLDAVRMLLSVGANINAVDLEGKTALHIAVIKNDKETIKLLINGKADTNIKDKCGNTALSYCKNNDDIKKLLSDPATNILFKLARGEFEDEKIALEILMTYSGVIGCLSKSQCVNVRGHLDKTPLMEAVIYSNFNVIKVLLEINADPNLENIHKINSLAFMEWINNPKIKKLFGNYQDVSHNMLNLKNSVKNQFDKLVLYLGNKPSREILMNNNMVSTVGKRMDNFINLVFDNDYKMIDSGNNTSIVQIQDKIEFCEIFKTPLFWNSKVFTTSIIASGSLDKNLTVENILALTLYTSNEVFSRILNETIIKNEINNVTPYIKFLYDTIVKLPVFEGEVFMGTGKQVDRSRYLVGSNVIWKTFNSASSLWTVAVENASNFQNRKEGTIFLIKSKTGRFVGQYSEFSCDAEVVFSPNSQFKVTNWYMGDVIALGQSNIREKTFGIKDDNLDRMINSNASLIIELTEL